MAHLVLGIGSSHGPSIQGPPERWARLGESDTKDPRFNFEEARKNAPPNMEAEIKIEKQRERHAAARAALVKLTEKIVESKVDVMVVLSNQHGFHPDDAQPVFGVIRSEKVPITKRSEQPFDPDSRFIREADRVRPEREIIERNGHPELANHLIETLVTDGFDVSCSNGLKDGAAIDDAFAFAFDWLLPPGSETAVVPFLVSRYLPHQATPARCLELGDALARSIAAWPTDARVGLIASGGLSHQIIDEEMDHQVIDALTSGDRDTLSKISRERLNKAPGTPETLNWMAVSTAMSPHNMTLVDYQPCYRSLAGTGHGVTFGYWDARI
jgi:hypothetical protein